jgi:DNA-binding transcriptional MerR regulator
MKAKEVSEITSVSIRTLHHWDSLGLLSPLRCKENKYREYSEDDLARLQQILFFKECGFSLKKIQSLLADKDFDREKAFILQKKYLLQERERIETMLETLEKSSRALKGGYSMDANDQFKGFDLTKNPYEKEARKQWGEESVKASQEHIDNLSKEKKYSMGKEMDALFEKLAGLRDEDPSSDKVQKAMEEMYRFFNSNFGYHYSLEAFAGLGQMYVEDERFTKTIDSLGKGLSVFLAKAMRVFADTKTKQV